MPKRITDPTELDLRRVAGFKECAARSVLSDYLMEQGREKEMPPLMPLFIGDCDDYERFLDYFYNENPDNFPTKEELLFVNNWEEGYEGAIHFVWRKGNQLYEESLSHCSCNNYATDMDWNNIDRCWVTVESLRIQSPQNYYPHFPKNSPDWQAICDAIEDIMAAVERGEKPL